MFVGCGLFSVDYVYLVYFRAFGLCFVVLVCCWVDWFDFAPGWFGLTCIVGVLCGFVGLISAGCVWFVCFRIFSYAVFVCLGGCLVVVIV